MAGSTDESLSSARYGTSSHLAVSFSGSGPRGFGQTVTRPAFTALCPAQYSAHIRAGGCSIDSIQKRGGALAGRQVDALPRWRDAAALALAAPVVMGALTVCEFDVFFFLMTRHPPSSTLSPHRPLFL